VPLQFRPGATSDVRYPPTVEQVIAAMCGSRLDRPLPLALVVHESMLGGDFQEDVTVPMVPTALRIMLSGHDLIQFPEFEFEGWVPSDEEPRVWVRGWLRTNSQSGEVEEASIRVLEPGEEWGTQPDNKAWGLD
jgi:hypothetical protein